MVTMISRRLCVLLKPIAFSPNYSRSAPQLSPPSPLHLLKPMQNPYPHSSFLQLFSQKPRDVVANSDSIASSNPKKNHESLFRNKPNIFYPSSSPNEKLEPSTPAKSMQNPFSDSRFFRLCSQKTRDVVDARNRSCSAPNVIPRPIFFSPDEKLKPSINPDSSQILNSEHLSSLANEIREVLDGMMKNINVLSNAVAVLGVVQLGVGTRINYITCSSPIAEVWI